MVPATSGPRRQPHKRPGSAGTTSVPRKERVVAAPSVGTRIGTVVGLVTLLAACAPTEEDAAVRAADDFVTAVSDGDAGEACALLAPATSRGARAVDAALPASRPCSGRPRPPVTGSRSAPSARCRRSATPTTCSSCLASTPGGGSWPPGATRQREACTRAGSRAGE